MQNKEHNAKVVESAIDETNSETDDCHPQSITDWVAQTT